MVWLFNRNPNYERELPALASQIRATQLRQLRLQAQHRRVAGLFLLYAAMVCVIIGLAVILVPQFSSRKHRILGAVLPLLVYAIRRVLDRWYRWRIDRQERTLVGLTERRKVLAEEYKQKTNYYKIRDLVDDPDEPHPNAQIPEPAGLVDGEVTTAPPLDPNDPNFTPGTNVLSGEVPAQPLPAAPEPKPTWVDRILDIILGENEQSPNNRFALICAYCHAHNGLAAYGQMPSQVKYRCRLCGQPNPPPEPGLPAESTTEVATETTSLLDEASHGELAPESSQSQSTNTESETRP